MSCGQIFIKFHLFAHADPDNIHIDCISFPVENINPFSSLALFGHHSDGSTRLGQVKSCIVTFCLTSIDIKTYLTYKTHIYIYN